MLRFAIALFIFFTASWLDATPVNTLVENAQSREWTMPDLDGLTESEVLERLAPYHLKIFSRKGGFPENEKQSLKVELQDPLPGEPIRPGYFIRVTYYQKYQPEVIVPKLIGLTPAEAQEKLSAMGLYYNETDVEKAKKYSDSQKIYWQKPTEGDKIRRGSAVNIRVYERYIPRVPPINGDSLGDARDKIKNEGLVPIIRIGEHAKREYDENRVYMITPEPHTPMQEFDSVIITIYDTYE